MNSSNMEEYSENSIEWPIVLNKRFVKNRDEWNNIEMSDIGQKIPSVFLACLSIVSLMHIYNQIYK